MEFKKGIATTLLASSLVSGCQYSLGESVGYELNAVVRPVERSFDLDQLADYGCLGIEDFIQIESLALHELESAYRSDHYTSISELFSFLVNCADDLDDEVLSPQKVVFYRSVAENPELVANIMYETYYSSPESVAVAFENIERLEDPESIEYWRNQAIRNLAEALWRDVFIGNDAQFEQLLSFFDEEGPVTQTEMHALADDALLERTTAEVLNNYISHEQACQVVDEVKQRGLADKLYNREFGSIFEQASYGQNFKGLEDIFFDRMVTCAKINDQ